MTVKEWALRQIHWMLQEGPWVQDIFLAAGASLDTMAERILAVYNFIDFSKLNLDQVRYYEWLLGLESDETKSLEGPPGGHPGGVAGGADPQPGLHPGHLRQLEGRVRDRYL